MNTYRKMLVEHIRNNCGYSNSRARYPLSWDVSTWRAKIDFDDCFNRCLKGEEARSFEGVDREAFKEFCDWDNEKYYNYAIEDMRNGVLENNDCYRTYGPDTAKRFGLSFYKEYSETYKPTDKYQRRTSDVNAYYPAKKDHWMLEGHYDMEYFDVEFGLEGRGGKHLVIKMFEGVNLKSISSDDLADDIENDDCGNYPNEWCKDLLVMITEWDIHFTTKNIAKDLEYRMDDTMVQLLDQFLLDEAIEEEACYGC